MKISELLEQLGELQGLYGDVDVHVQANLSTVVELIDAQYCPYSNEVKLLGREV